MNYPLLEISDLTIAFSNGEDNVNAIENVSLTVNRGEIVALVGESGSGKSVTALSILRLLPTPPALVKSGMINFSTNGESPTNLLACDPQTIQAIRGNKIGFIFQEPMTSLNPVMRCGKQVAEAMVLHKGLTFKQAKTATIDWFRKVKLPQPEILFDRYPHQLSGGQKQRVMIALAMCCNPSLLICDEPTTALDVSVQKVILDLIRDLQRTYGIAVIFITHDLGVVAEIADRAVVMYKGNIVETGNTKRLLSVPEHPYTKALLACRPINHPRGSRLPVVSDFLQSDSGTSNPVSGSMSTLIPKTESSSAGSTLISVRNLSIWFPSNRNLFGAAREMTKAVNDISFDVYEGETLGLVGESGCGKTTLGRALLGLIPPTHGSILYKGSELSKKSEKELRLLRKDIQIVFQDPFSSLNPRKTIGSSILEPLIVHEIGANEKQRKEMVMDLLKKVNLSTEHFNRYPHEFSGGQRQRIVIARALILNPSFVVCDESVSALDISVQAQVLNLLNDLKAEMGFTIIFISHDLSVVRYISDRILVMNQGKIEESGPADEVFFNPKAPYTKNLIASIPGIQTAS